MLLLVTVLDAAMHAHAIHSHPSAVGMHDADATGPVDTPRTDHGICVSTVDSHGRHESGDAESGEYEKAHGCLLGLGLTPIDVSVRSG
jgi:hypothetical protein